MLVVGESAGKHIKDYSAQFQGEFVAMLSRRWGTKRVRINQVYQEYISDKAHLHMNATRWLSLTEFCKHLGRSGLAHVDETEKGWFIAWIDNSPKALAKQDASQKKERGDLDDESRQRKLIQEQIERARREGERRRVEAAGGVWTGERDPEDGESPALPEEPEFSRELKRDEGEKVSLSFSFKAKAPEPAVVATSVSPKPEFDDANATDTPTEEFVASTSTSLAPPSTSSFISLPSKSAPVSSFAPKPSVFKPKVNPLKANPLKRPNPLKAVSSSSASSNAGTKRPAPVSAVEAIIQEEMARKNRAPSTLSKSFSLKSSQAEMAGFGHRSGRKVGGILKKNEYADFSDYPSTKPTAKDKENSQNTVHLCKKHLTYHFSSAHLRSHSSNEHIFKRLQALAPAAPTAKVSTSPTKSAPSTSK
ncbi:DNA/RNA-binding protein KIN17, partial [Phenoliferia sp. Uapishka_3]